MTRIVIETTTGPVTFATDPDESVLAAGLRHGVALPYECATGTCGTCRARLVEGDFDEGWAEAPGRQGLKAARREVLMCQGAPLTDCRLALLDPLGNWRQEAALPSEHASRIARLEHLTSDMMGLSLVLPGKIAFEAGQFMLLATPRVAGFRAYSMANGDVSAQQLDFIVKRKPGGAFSEWLFGGARPGDAVRLFGPLGSAVLEPALKHDLLLAVGGSGVAPALSILTRAAQDGYLGHHRARLFVGVRTLQDATCLSQISAWRERFEPAFEVTVALSEAGVDAAGRSRWPGIRFGKGMVHESVASDLPVQTGNTMAFLAGPPAMVDATRRVLMLQGRIAPSRIRFDKFT